MFKGMLSVMVLLVIGLLLTPGLDAQAKKPKSPKPNNTEPKTSQSPSGESGLEKEPGQAIGEVILKGKKVAILAPALFLEIMKVGGFVVESYTDTTKRPTKTVYFVCCNAAWVDGVKSGLSYGVYDKNGSIVGDTNLFVLPKAGETSKIKLRLPVDDIDKVASVKFVVADAVPRPKGEQIAKLDEVTFGNKKITILAQGFVLDNVKLEKFHCEWTGKKEARTIFGVSCLATSQVDKFSGWRCVPKVEGDNVTIVFDDNAGNSGLPAIPALAKGETTRNRVHLGFGEHIDANKLSSVTLVVHKSPDSAAAIFITSGPITNLGANERSFDMKDVFTGKTLTFAGNDVTRVSVGKATKLTQLMENDQAMVVYRRSGEKCIPIVIAGSAVTLGTIESFTRRTIKNPGGTSNSIILGDGKTKTQFRFAPGAKIYIDGKTALFNDLKEGDRCAVAYYMDAATWYATYIDCRRK